MAGESPWYEQLLDLQLRENAKIWAAYETQGLDRSSLRLGFVYLAPGREEAEQLGLFLLDETDYEVRVSSQPNPRNGATEWLVVGATQPTAVTLDLLNEWVEWMIAAGAAEGPCAFDGWAAQVPEG